MLGARRRLNALADRLLPPEAALFDQSVGMARTQMLGTVAELGVADELAKGPATAEELAGRLGVNADALHRVLRALALSDVVRPRRPGALLARPHGAGTPQRPPARACATGRATSHRSPTLPPGPT